MGTDSKNPLRTTVTAFIIRHHLIVKSHPITCALMLLRLHLFTSKHLIIRTHV